MIFSFSVFRVLLSSFKCPRTRFSLALKAERHPGPSRARDPSRRSLFPRARVSGPTARSHGAGFRSVRDGPPRIAGFLRRMHRRSRRAAPKQSPLHSEHTSCRRDSAIKLMVDGGGLATYPATIDNPRNPSPRIVTDTIIHPASDACRCSVRLEMLKRNKVSKLQRYRIFQGHATRD